MSPAGRPPLSGERKKIRLEVLLTDDERALLDSAAKIVGKPTSTWGRDTLLETARQIVAAAESATPAKKRAGKRPGKKPQS